MRSLVERGIAEVTLLGQTVNAYGRHDVRRGQAAAAGTMPFAELLARLDGIPGLERIRYTSPHPLFFDEALIRAHGELERLCPHVHLPLQSGSNRILEAMRRRYTRERYLEIAAALRAARQDLVLTTDLIVGFPGESDADFEATLSIVEEAGFVDSFSFKYSPRPGTGAAEMEATVSGELAQERLDATAGAPAGPHPRVPPVPSGAGDPRSRRRREPARRPAGLGTGPPPAGGEPRPGARGGPAAGGFRRRRGSSRPSPIRCGAFRSDLV